MTDSFLKYAKAIGVNIEDNDIHLMNIAYKGFTEKLGLNYVYEIVNNQIAYKNIDSGNIYAIHPNYKSYRNIVNEFKLNRETEKSHISSEDNMKYNLKHACDDNVDELEKNLKKLDLLEKPVNKVCIALKEDNLLSTELTKKYENIDKSQQEAKALHKVFLIESEKATRQMISVKRHIESTEKESSINFNISTDKPFDCMNSLLETDSENEYDDDLTLNLNCLNDEDFDELRYLFRESFTDLLALRK